MSHRPGRKPGGPKNRVSRQGSRRPRGSSLSGTSGGRSADVLPSVFQTGSDVQLELVQLARRAVSGDTRVEARIVELCFPQTFALVVARMRDRETAREVANDVMLALLMALRRGVVRDLDKLGAFIRGITVRLVCNRLRHDGRQPRSQTMEFDIASPHPAEEYERLDQIQHVQASLNRLDSLDRRILSLTLIQGLKPGEIASHLQLSVDVVRQRKCRALRELAEMLGPSRRPVR